MADGTLVFNQRSVAPSGISASQTGMWVNSSGELNITNSNGNTTNISLNDGWTPANATWTYYSASAIAITDATFILIKGDKIKYTSGSATNYHYVVGFGSGSIALVTGGTDYTVPNAAITSNYYSHQASPLGFPQWFNYTPTGFNIGGTGLAYTGVFSMSGRSVYFQINVTGTSASATLGISYLALPTGLVNSVASTCTATNSFVSNLGVGLIAGSVVFPPAWTAAAYICITGTYLS